MRVLTEYYRNKSTDNTKNDTQFQKKIPLQRWKENEKEMQG